ncbi:MAG TPA: PhzF family phenazine biosynthesis protein [Blastocatellia bacterium]|nr:PhzF family phenazine biosynthesis protein [Blastocatellia bacterium]
MSNHSFVIADVFTDRHFGGNQLAVFTDGSMLDTDTMQNIAREMNYSETTFLLPPEKGGDYRVRIFTPAHELPFAGHPIVGTGFVIAATGLKRLSSPSTELKLETGVGIINVDVAIKDGKPGHTRMSQPLPEVRGRFEDTERLAKALGLERSRIDSTELPVEPIYNGIEVLIVPVDSLASVKRLEIDAMALRQISSEVGAETVLVFTRETVEPSSTVHCRVAAPAAGVYEDAATGSANGPLGYYLVRHKLVDLKPTTLIVSEQGYEMKRPSKLHIEVDLDTKSERVTAVRVGGGVVISGRGEIILGSGA